MTGEITLRGKVLPVGGIKEKVIAAKSAGIKRVLLPDKNEKDLEDVSDPVRAALRFSFVSEIGEVLDLAFAMIFLLAMVTNLGLLGWAHLPATRALLEDATRPGDPSVR